MPPRRRAAARPRAASGDLPPKITGPLAVCVGGPRDGWVYYVSELEQMARGHDATKHGRPPYRATRDTRPWRLDPSIDCQVWRESS